MKGHLILEKIYAFYNLYIRKICNWRKFLYRGITRMAWLPQALHFHLLAGLSLIFELLGPSTTNDDKNPGYIHDMCTHTVTQPSCIYVHINYLHPWRC